MTADIHQEAELRHWLVDYRVTNIGSAPEEIDLDLSLNDLGVGSPKGVGGRFPAKICGSEALWQFVCEGRSAIGQISPDRWQPFDDGSSVVAAVLARINRGARS
jgi:hypothetical protein